MALLLQFLKNILNEFLMDDLVKDASMLKEESLTKNDEIGIIKSNSNKNDFQKFNSAEAYYNKAIEFQKNKNLNDAIKFFKKAISLRPEYVDAYFNIGRILYSMGKYYYAIETFNVVISLEPENFDAYHYLAISIQKGSFKETKPHLHSSMLKLLQKPNLVNPNNISRAVISLIKTDPTIKDLLLLKDNSNIDDHIIKIITNLSNQKMLTELMSLTPLVDLDIENLLTKVRSFILINIDKIQNIPTILDIQKALALQCFINEYLYKEHNLETKALEELEQSIKLSFSKGNQPKPSFILCLASYRPLHLYNWSKLISLPNQFEKISKTLIKDFFIEKKLSSEIPVLKEVFDKVSFDVRKQYEENPYPKWTNIRLNSLPFTLAEVIENSNLKLINKEINMITSPDILIAGCGTGKHSIDIATNYKNSKILAVDLSLRSLSYAKRKTQELNINNIRYMQADILDLEKLGKQFDIIECGGVLHHMKNPMAGWQVLKNCLKPGGLMKIGLYSELAREYVVRTRNEISEKKIGTTNFEIKSFRNSVTKLSKSHHHDLIKIVDFYDLSSFRDLVFHAQEHRFTIKQIRDHLFKLGLSFCGFIVDDEIKRRFIIQNKNLNDEYDLEKWRFFEEANPNTFSAMYQFWCQKI